MNQLQTNALLEIITRIREMIFDDPSQPLKNVSHLVDETLVNKSIPSLHDTDKSTTAAPVILCYYHGKPQGTCEECLPVEDLPLT